MNPRQGILFALLAATLAAVWWVGQEEDGEGDAPEVAAAVRHAPKPAAVPARPAAQSTPAAAVKDEDDSRFPVGGPDLFPGTSWRPPPPPAPVVVAPPPPPPMAPPLPFKYLGRWQDERGETVFLDQGNRVLDARVGQRLEQWRLDKIGADNLDFTYMPLGQQRQLRLTP